MEFQIGDIMVGEVTGIQPYGAFIRFPNEECGLIHISEISYGYVKDVHDFVHIGDNIYAEVIQVDNHNKKMKLSIKDIDYKKSGVKLKRMSETKSGFQPLEDHLEEWINKKIKDIANEF